MFFRCWVCVVNNCNTIFSATLAIAFICTPIEPAGAQTQQFSHPSQSSTIIEEVLSEPEFQAWKEIPYWTLKSQEEDAEPREGWKIAKLLARIINAVATLSEALLWGLLAFGIIYLIINRERWMKAFSKRTSEQPPPPQKVILGMDITPETLPGDISGEAWRLWQANDQRAALGLLYRGSLAALVNQEQLELTPSHTEGDIVALAQTYLPADKADYQARLTRSWQTVAYGHRAPDDDEGRTLCLQWSRHFAPLT